MKWKAKNFSESLIPLQMSYAIIGHGVFRYPVERRHPIFSSIYAIILTTTYCIAFGYTLDFSFNSSWFGNAEKVFLWMIYTNVAIAALAQILSWYYEKSFCRFIERISKVDETLRKLGATFDYNKTFNWGIASVVAWMIIIFCLNAIDFLWLLNLMPVHQTIIIVSVIHHPVHMNSIIAFNFSVAVRLIGTRFRKANDLLEEIANPFRQSINNRMWQYFGNRIRARTLTISTIFNSTQNKKDVIQIIKHVHMELNEISNDLNEAFGIQIALEITAYYVLFTVLLYDVYILYMNPSHDRRSLIILVLAVWSLTYFTKLILMNYACEDVSTEAHRTGGIIHRIYESTRDPELSNEIKQFSLQIIHHPLFISPAGIFTLGFKFVVGFLAKVATYLVVLVQMRGAPIH